MSKNVWRPPVPASNDKDARENFGHSSRATNKLNKKDAHVSNVVLVRSTSWSRFDTSEVPKKTTRNVSKGECDSDECNPPFHPECTLPPEDVFQSRLQSQLGENSCIINACPFADTIDSDRMPSWSIKRPYILSGYRRAPLPLRSTLCSLFQLHNETVNIWSHLLGFLVWAWGVESVLERTRKLHADNITQAVTVISQVFCCLMPLCSSLYHLLRATSPLLQRVTLSLDMMGIVVLWFARVLEEGYLVFYCHRHGYGWSAFLCFAVVLFVTLGYCVVLDPEDHRFLVPLFLMAHVPVVGLMVSMPWSPPSLGSPVVVLDSNGNPTDFIFSTVDYAWPPAVVAHLKLSCMGTLCGFIAFVFFFLHIPERWSPGTFDYCLHSHQIWHVLTWGGPAFVLAGMDHLLQHRLNTECPA